MLEIASASINNFVSRGSTPGYVSPDNEEPIFVLTAPQLQDLIREATEPLREEIQDLRATVARQTEDIAALEATQETHADNQLIQLRLINGLKEERAPPEPTQKTLDRLDEIAAILGAKENRLIEGQAAASYLARFRKEGMTFSQLANVMGMTVDRIRQLSRIAATDQRFNVTWHPRKKNTKIIKLRRWDVQGF